MALTTKQIEPVKRVILVADEHEKRRAVLVRLLQDNGYAVLEAATGAEMLDLAAASAPNAILLAGSLPASGADMVRRLRENASTRRTAIVRYSDQGVGSGSEEGDEFLTYPFAAHELLLVLEGSIRRRAGSR
jgi:DNA-binding response OmpR family regulator